MRSISPLLLTTTSVLSALHVCQANDETSYAQQEDSTMPIAHRRMATFWDENRALSIALIVVGSLLACLCLCWWDMNQNRKHRMEKDRKFTLNIFSYLRRFDVDDIDIRRSPAGGYHVSYQGDNLKEGIVDDDGSPVPADTSSDSETQPLSAKL